MKNLKDMVIESIVNEAMDENTKVKLGATHELLAWLRSELENVEGTIGISGSNLTYDKAVLEYPKISAGLTAGEYADALVEFINKRDEAKHRANKHITVRKLRKNAGMPRGNYGAKEKQDARRAELNRRVIAGTDKEVNPSMLKY